MVNRLKTNANSLNRRQFLQLTTSSVLALASGDSKASKTFSKKGKVVIIGGGVGGMLVARQLLAQAPKLEIFIVEKNKNYHACFKGNEALAEMRDADSLTFDYHQVSSLGLKIVIGSVENIDIDKKVVTINDGNRLIYDRLVISTGIDFHYDRVEGYSRDAGLVMPHAWTGSQHFDILRKQLVSMPDNGTVLISAPPGKFRCPPGPYERASLIANYLQKNKPKAKLIIVDSQESFSKQPLFIKAWKELYGFGSTNSIIEHISGSYGGRVTKVDPVNMSVVLENGEKIKTSVCNFIPPQYAGELLRTAGLMKANEDWCPIQKSTMRSLINPHVYVLGDASEASSMPKSAFSAGSQARICSNAILNDFFDVELPKPKYTNTCFSLIKEDYGISISMRYAFDRKNNAIVKTGGSTTSINASREELKYEALFSQDWYNNITSYMFKV